MYILINIIFSVKILNFILLDKSDTLCSVYLVYLLRAPPLLFFEYPFIGIIISVVVFYNICNINIQRRLLFRKGGVQKGDQWNPGYLLTWSNVTYMVQSSLKSVRNPPFTWWYSPFHLSLFINVSVWNYNILHKCARIVFFTHSSYAITNAKHI